MSPDVLTLLVALIGGGVGSQLVTWMLGRERREARRIDSLRRDVERLSWEVVVLSEELSALGGDPVRARLEAHRRARS